MHGEAPPELSNATSSSRPGVSSSASLCSLTGLCQRALDLLASLLAAWLSSQIRADLHGARVADTRESGHAVENILLLWHDRSGSVCTGSPPTRETLTAVRFLVDAFGAFGSQQCPVLVTGSPYFHQISRPAFFLDCVKPRWSSIFSFVFASPFA